MNAILIIIKNMLRKNIIFAKSAIFNSKTSTKLMTIGGMSMHEQDWLLYYERKPPWSTLLHSDIYDKERKHAARGKIKVFAKIHCSDMLISELYITNTHRPHSTPQGSLSIPAGPVLSPGHTSPAPKIQVSGAWRDWSCSPGERNLR